MPDHELVELGLGDPRWLRDRIRDTGRRWDCADPRVNATLWWYSASSVIVFPLVAEVLARGSADRPDPARGWLRDHGYLGGLAVLPGESVGVAELPATIVHLCAPTIELLALLGGVRPAPLWAVLGDSISARALDAARGRTPAEPVRTLLLDDDLRIRMARASWLASDVVDGVRTLGHPVPRPRFLDVGRDRTTPADADEPVNPSTIRAVRRGSCCLIHLTTSTPHRPEAMCASCPRLRAAERHSRMSGAMWNHPEP